MPLSASQIVTDELANLGLKPGANANQINSALRSHFPGGIATSSIDTRTGLPYTQATAKDAGSGNLVGLILGGGLLGYTVGTVVGGALAIAGGAESTVAGGLTAADVNAATDPAVVGGTDAAAGAGAAGTAEAGAAGAAATTLNTALKAAGAGATAIVLADIWGKITNPSNWLRALEVLGAVVAIYLGVRSLTGAPGVVETAEALKP